MIPRHIETALRQRMSTTAPAVVLLGPRQVGKTTLARKIAADWPTGALYLDTERPADRRLERGAAVRERGRRVRGVDLHDQRHLPRRAGQGDGRRDAGQVRDGGVAAVAHGLTCRPR